MCDFFEGHASTKGIWAMRSIGEKKSKTIFSILLEAWKFEQGDSDRIAGLNDNPEIEEVEVLTPMALLEGKWMEFCDAVLEGDSFQTSLEKHYEALGIKCSASLRALSVSDVIEAASLREFIASRKGIGKKKVDDLAIVLHRLWATIQPGGPAGFPPDPHEEAREIYDEMLGSSLEQKIDKALEIAGVSPKTREIIDKRYGFSEGRPKILEELGAENGVTRERIRQIQAAAGWVPDTVFC